MKKRYAIAMLICLVVLSAVGSYYLWKHIITNDKISKLPSAKSFPEEWDDYPLTSMHIRSSHNTYLGDQQYMEKPSADNIKSALQLGARCIELDVDLNETNELVVVHANKTKEGTPEAPFANMLAAVEEYAFKNVNDPLIICLELRFPDKEELSAAVARVLVNSKLPLFQREEFNVQNVLLEAIPIKYLRNKVLIISNSTCQSMKDLDMTRIGYFANTGSSGDKAKQPQSTNSINRLYFDSTYAITGGNSNAAPYMQRGFGVVAMNFGFHDDELYNYLNAFGEYCMMPMDGVVPLVEVK